MITISTLKKHAGSTFTVAGYRFIFGFKDLGALGKSEPVWSTKDYLVLVDFKGKEHGYDLCIDVRYMGGKDVQFEWVAHEAYKGKVETFEEYKQIVKFLVIRAFEKTGGKPFKFVRDSNGKMIQTEEQKNLEKFTKSQVFATKKIAK
jgi:hypothetical protein